MSIYRMGINRGFAKEREIISVLNKIKFKDLNSNYKEKIKEIFQEKIEINDELACSKNEGVGLEKKTDLTLTVKNKQINMSIKIGSGNSLHQESIHSFIQFLKSNKKLTRNQIDLIYEFHWCDGTFDNTGSFSNRKRRSDYKKKNYNRYTAYIDILRNYKNEIFTRVILGSVNQPDYLVYFENFEKKIPHFIEKSELLMHHVGVESKEDHIGIFTLQNCNACLKGQDHGHESHICNESCPRIKPMKQKYRNDIQFKMIDIKKNIL